MRVLVCADAHANLPSLEAVLSRVTDVDRKVFLGDAISYGPHPKECLDLVMREFDLVLAGNHDLWATESHPPPAPGKARDGYDWDEWTRARLTPGDPDLIRRLPRAVDEVWDGKHVHLEHQLPGPYVMPDVPDRELLERIKDMPGELIWVAHAHRQMDRTVNGRRVINPGSLGQQRDGDPRVGYAIFDGGRIELHRAEYDIARTREDMRALPLRREFIRCWLRFLEEGIIDMASVPSPKGDGQ